MAISGGTYLNLTSHNPLGGISSELPSDDLEFFKLTESLTLSTGATTTTSTSGLLPANSIILGVLVTVTTAITTAASLTVGDGTTAAKWGSLAAMTLGSTNMATFWTPFKADVTTTAQGPPVGASALSVILTANTNPGAGAVRVTVFGLKLKAGSV